MSWEKQRLADETVVVSSNVFGYWVPFDYPVPQLCHFNLRKMSVNDGFDILKYFQKKLVPIIHQWKQCWNKCYGIVVQKTIFKLHSCYFHRNKIGSKLGITALYFQSFIHLALEHPTIKIFPFNPILTFPHCYHVKNINIFVAERYLDFHLTRSQKSAMSSRHPRWVQLFYFHCQFVSMTDVWTFVCHYECQREQCQSHSGWLESWMNIAIHVFHLKPLVIPYICVFFLSLNKMFVSCFSIHFLVSVYAHIYML